MRVIRARVTSCPTNAVVSVAVEDAQGMLNDFNAREENLMQKIQPELMANNTGVQS
jgi:hypothetical protein